MLLNRFLGRSQRLKIKSLNILYVHGEGTEKLKTGSREPSGTTGIVESNKYFDAVSKATDYLISQICINGYISASLADDRYDPHWIRDSSWVAVALLEYANFAKGKVRNADTAKEAATRIIDFNLAAIDKFSRDIRSIKNMSFSDPNFFNLSHHLPARVGRSGNFYFSNFNPEDSIVDASKKITDDREQIGVNKSWLIQYDTIPLVLYSLNEKSKLFDLNRFEIDFLKNLTRDIAEYMAKVYTTECASAWVTDSDKSHAYDVAAIYAGFESLKELSKKYKKYDLGISPEEIEEIEEKGNGLFFGGPLEFLKQFFVRDNILYSEKEPFKEPLKQVDASEIFIFLNFGISGKLLGSEEIEDNTISKMEKELFDGNKLPIRFKGDTYFMGGRWLPLGLAFAEYYIKKGLYKKGVPILNYVIDKYNGSYPEQEIVNPASNIDQNGYYEQNGNQPIQKLAWSYAAVITASLELLHSPTAEQAIKVAARK